MPSSPIEGKGYLLPAVVDLKSFEPVTIAKFLASLLMVTFGKPPTAAFTA